MGQKGFKALYRIISLQRAFTVSELGFRRMNTDWGGESHCSVICKTLKDRYLNYAINFEIRKSTLVVQPCREYSLNWQSQGTHSNQAIAISSTLSSVKWRVASGSMLNFLTHLFATSICCFYVSTLKGHNIMLVPSCSLLSHATPG